jgi:AcrR family transcriptional regulator
MAPTGPPSLPRVPLRERKRLAAMRRIQDVAIDQFEQHGFDEVTIEQVAAASEVSPSSVYRYFGTKEQLVVWDPHDDAAIQLVGQDLPDLAPLEAIRTVIVDTLGEAFRSDPERIRRRLQLAFTHPSIEAALNRQTAAVTPAVAALIAHHLSRTIDDLDVQVLSYAFVGGLLGALRHWHTSGYTTPVDDLIMRPLAILERSLERP